MSRRRCFRQVELRKDRQIDSRMVEELALQFKSLDVRAFACCGGHQRCLAISTRAILIVVLARRLRRALDRGRRFGMMICDVFVTVMVLVRVAMRRCGYFLRWLAAAVIARCLNERKKLSRIAAAQRGSHDRRQAQIRNYSNS